MVSFLTLAVVSCAAIKSLVSALSLQPSARSVDSRRAFFAKVPAVVASSAVMGAFVNFDSHEVGCQCNQCLSFGPQPASAYERDVGGEGRSSDTAAMNLQARETNSRLEKEGFKLDTKEEETARLSDALSSFSYESTSSQTGKQGKGYQKSDAVKSSTKK